jgi:hypothetical protein
MPNDRERLQDLIRDVLRGQRIEDQLDALFEDLVTRVEADPELQRMLVRDALRSAMFTSFWNRR